MWRLILQWNRLIELLAYIFSMVYVVDDLQLDDTSFTISEGSRQVNSYCSNNNGNFICVFECTIVNLTTYRQFTNAA